MSALSICYWRCNITRQIRIMRNPADPLSVVGRFTLRGSMQQATAEGARSLLRNLGEAS